MIPIFLALAFIAIILIVVVAGQPCEFTVSRSAKISVPPEKIFPYVNDLHQWNNWSPWAKLDPNAKITFSGPDAGVGEAMRWEGNSKIGVGRMTIIDSQPNNVIRLRLDFEKPMLATNTAEFSFLPDNRQTLVTWAMRGKNNLGGKIFGLAFNFDKMVGDKYEEGLANLKAVAEK
ncbi:MAG TPA: SRPBCC family protein [Candidatus Sulfotelmatobacter sp.]|jgi:hypothetical protein|nr:SRPBCC family protein [Candidatus Sulfotelmatobacter sp.]